MATIKAFSDLEQSKVLAKILPLESADMVWANDNDVIVVPYELTTRENVLHDFIPCWSLAALLNVLPKIQGFKPIMSLYYNYIAYPHMSNLYTKADNLIDACVAMIERLHELNLL